MNRSKEILEMLNEKLDDSELVFLWTLHSDPEELEAAKKDQKGKKLLQKLVKKGVLSDNFEVTAVGEKELKNRSDEVKELIGG